MGSNNHSSNPSHNFNNHFRDNLNLNNSLNLNLNNLTVFKVNLFLTKSKQELTEKAAKKNILKNQQNTPPPQPQPSFRQPQPQPQPQQNFRQQQPSFQPQNNFGVFEAVNLSSGPNPSPSPVPAVPSRSFESRQAGNEAFFGVFPEVNLQ